MRTPSFLSDCKAIINWYGSLDAFSAYVRGSFREDVVEPMSIFAASDGLALRFQVEIWEMPQRVLTRTLLVPLVGDIWPLLDSAARGAKISRREQERLGVCVVPGKGIHSVYVVGFRLFRVM